jgi:hypothetical protein
MPSKVEYFIRAKNRPQQLLMIYSDIENGQIHESVQTNENVQR